jgi:hypothetical protein
MLKPSFAIHNVSYPYIHILSRNIQPLLDVNIEAISPDISLVFTPEPPKSGNFGRHATIMYAHVSTKFPTFS